MISLTHFAARDDSFAERARTALQALSRRPGYLRGTVGRCTDAIDQWVLITEWANVGSYRRALGAFEVKVAASELLGEALALPSSFEALIETEPGGPAIVRDSDHA